MHAVIYKGVLSEAGNVATSLDPLAARVNSAESIGETVRARLAVELDPARLTFPLAELTADGKSHSLTLTMDRQELGPVLVDLPAIAAPASPFSRWWLQLLGGCSVVGLLALLTRWRSAAGLRR